MENMDGIGDGMPDGWKKIILDKIFLCGMNINIKGLVLFEPDVDNPSQTDFK